MAIFGWASLALLIGVVVFGVVASATCEKGWGFGAVVCGVFAAVFGVIFVVAAFDYKVAGVKAGIINREYGTEYTQEEIFYAEDVIDTIRQIDRTRIEIQRSNP